MGWFGKNANEIAQDDHNRGEQDASEGKYDPPGDPVSDILGLFIPGIDADDAREDYQAGWDNTTNQLKK